MARSKSLIRQAKPTRNIRRCMSAQRRLRPGADNSCTGTSSLSGSSVLSAVAICDRDPRLLRTCLTPPSTRLAQRQAVLAVGRQAARGGAAGSAVAALQGSSGLACETGIPERRVTCQSSRGCPGPNAVALPSPPEAAKPPIGGGPSGRRAAAHGRRDESFGRPPEDGRGGAPLSQRELRV